MREELHRFFRAARGAGVRVSPAESIDAMRAVADVGFADRGVLRDTLLLTLAKSQDEKQALGDCFDLFFSHPEPKSEMDDASGDDANASADPSDATSPASAGGAPQDGGGETAELGELAQMLLAQDR
ncbi:VWA containing CoxE family protein, partial [Rhodopseudomonas palustris]|nr:VWA containing CoxE family protein [Rhodopseudomonas palustris]